MQFHQLNQFHSNQFTFNFFFNNLTYNTHLDKVIRKSYGIFSIMNHYHICILTYWITLFVKPIKSHTQKNIRQKYPLSLILVQYLHLHVYSLNVPKCNYKYSIDNNLCHLHYIKQFLSILFILRSFGFGRVKLLSMYTIHNLDNHIVYSAYH